MSSFVHLHNHTHYSLLDGACRIEDLVQAARKFDMTALAITDHGNMFGAIPFYKEVLKAGLKPIIGMEAYIAPKSRLIKTGGKSGETTSFHLILLARNLDGYRNLMKLSSVGFLEGFYYKPRIDKEILQQYADGLIVLSSCMKGEIPYKIIHDDYEGAKKAALFYQNLFGDNFYLEIQNHGIPEEEKAVLGIFKLSRELNIPVVATNDTHYLKQEHSAAQDVLLCIQTNKDRDDPSRMRFMTDQIYFKNPDEMAALFPTIPEALETSLEIAEKCHLVIDFETLHLPRFRIPDVEGIYTLDDYLEKKAREGLSQKYESVTDELKKRLEYELSVIRKMGYAGYFLIVMDFIEYARNQDIPVGPGRGSAAGSLVSYAIGITNVDPMRYGLLFERFLNPDRVSMPDIDIDFCYEQRDAIIKYVREKYGDDNVTQIITFGSMNARAVIRDVGRVLKIPYGEVDQIAKMIPALPGTNLKTALEKVPDFKAACDKDNIHKELIDYSLVLEGLARHASTHAAGVVITPDELTKFVPLYKASQGEVTTQYDMKSLENVGLLKMDFLGLRTLTVIDHTVKALRQKGIVLDIDNIPLDDKETYAIFGNGETVGIFQFESSGMRDYLKKLQPESIEDLTAMNALYRPGPMEWIDDFIDRKHGRKKVEYLHPMLRDILEETHGIIVYQEQVMQIASHLAAFSLGKADILRRAMGKKIAALMQEQSEAFVEGAKSNHIPEETAKQIFELIDRFAGYGFNKSHAACYSIIAYHTAYLKAHYPKEFMAANLTSEMNNTDRIVILIDDCRRLGIEVLPPDVNTSQANFIVSEEGIRFGLGAVKNVGLGAIQVIVQVRDKDGNFNNIYDFCRRVDLRKVNKKVVESLIQAGATDSLEGTRAQQMAASPKAMQLAQSYQQSAGRGQTTIFGASGQESQLYPDLPVIDPWTQTEKLAREKALLGIYVSGHPLMKYQDEINAFCHPRLDHLDSCQLGQAVRVCGIVTEVRTRFDRKDKQMAFFTLEEFSGTVNVIAFSDVFEKYKELIQPESLIMLKGKLDCRDDKNERSIIAGEIIPLNQVRQKYTKRLSLNLLREKIQQETIDRLHLLLRKYPGKCEVYLNLKSEQDEDLLLHSKKFHISPTVDLLKDLRQVLGKENVWIEG